jgi:hypothetical protein
MLYWTSDKNHERDIVGQTFEMVLMELSLHRREVWDTYAPVVIARVGEEYDIVPRHLPRFQVYRRNAGSYIPSWM